MLSVSRNRVTRRGAAAAVLRQVFD